MNRSKDKYRITQTLLSSWLWVYKKDTGYEEFLQTLHREKTPPTKAMLDGIRFENCVNSLLDGETIDESHEWYKPVSQLGKYLHGSQKQVTVFRDIDVGGQTITLHGVLDFLKAGVIYDTKFSTTYKVGKYLTSPQHPMYLRLVPEAYKFQYVICDGTYIYRETYRPDEIEPIDRMIEQFLNYLELHKLTEDYKSLWKINN